MFSTKNAASLYFSHGDEVEQIQVDKLNGWLKENGCQLKVSFEVDPDGVHIEFVAQ
jgi:hypothetical protein